MYVGGGGGSKSPSWEAPGVVQGGAAGVFMINVVGNCLGLYILKMEPASLVCGTLQLDVGFYRDLED